MSSNTITNFFNSINNAFRWIGLRSSHVKDIEQFFGLDFFKIHYQNFTEVDSRKALGLIKRLEIMAMKVSFATINS